MKKQTAVLLIAVVLASLFIRLYPVVLNDDLLKYDSYYHVRIAEWVKEEGTVPMIEPWPVGGKPHVYPPLYHLLLVFFSFFIPLMVSIKLLLPIISGLLPLAVFWFARKYWSEEASLLAAAFVAFNPFLINASFDSPQAISFLLLLPVFYYVLRGKYYLSSVFLALMLLTNPFSGFLLSLFFIVFLVIEKKARELNKVLLLPLAVFLAWYAPRGALSNFSTMVVGFIIKEVKPEAFLNVFLLVPAFIVLFLTRARNSFERFWYLFSCFFLLLYLSVFVSPALHPWRHDAFIMLGVSMLAGKLFSKATNTKKLLALLVFSFFLLAQLNVFVHSNAFKPILSESDFDSMKYLNGGVLSDHDYCATAITLYNISCFTDVAFDVSFDPTRAYEFEEFFWASKPKQMQRVITEYSPDVVVFARNDWGALVLNELNVNKTYESWQCIGNFCLKPTSVYEV